MIQVSNLSKKYGSHVAVNDVSFTVYDGEILVPFVPESRISGVNRFIDKNDILSSKLRLIILKYNHL